MLSWWLICGPLARVAGFATSLKSLYVSAGLNRSRLHRQTDRWRQVNSPNCHPTLTHSVYRMRVIAASHAATRSSTVSPTKKKTRRTPNSAIHTAYAIPIKTESHRAPSGGLNPVGFVYEKNILRILKIKNVLSFFYGSDGFRRRRILKTLLSARC